MFEQAKTFDNLDCATALLPGLKNFTRRLSSRSTALLRLSHLKYRKIIDKCCFVIHVTVQFMFRLLSSQKWMAIVKMNSTSFGNKHAKFTPTDISLWQWMNYFNTTLLLLKRADILFDRVLCLQDSDAFGCADASSRFISEWPCPSVVVHGKCCCLSY